MRDGLLSTVSYGALEHGIRAGIRDRVTRSVDAAPPAKAARVDLRMLRGGDTINITHRAYLAVGLYRFAAVLILRVLPGALKQGGEQ